MSAIRPTLISGHLRTSPIDLSNIWANLSDSLIFFYFCWILPGGCHTAYLENLNELSLLVHPFRKPCCPGSAAIALKCSSLLFHSFLNSSSWSGCPFIAAIVLGPTSPSSVTPRILCGYLIPHTPEVHSQSTRRLAMDWFLISSALHLSQYFFLKMWFHWSSVSLLRSEHVFPLPYTLLNVAMVTPDMVHPPLSLGLLLHPPSHFLTMGTSSL